jgi:hypothetical protein
MSGSIVIFIVNINTFYILIFLKVKHHSKDPPNQKRYKQSKFIIKNNEFLSKRIGVHQLEPSKTFE